jgi:hypothetical protein
VEGIFHGDLIQQTIEAFDGPDLPLRIAPHSNTLEGELDEVRML